MNEKAIGQAECPLCGAGTPLKETKKFKAYLCCEGCGCQIFARGPVSDAALRGLARGEVKALAAPQDDKKPVATVRRHSSDGGTSERTIFDMLGDALKGQQE